MSIVRAERPEQYFFTVRNDVARDSRLSFRARGILIAILSRPDGWSTTSAQLQNEGKEGREAIRTALRELRAHGYLKVVRYQNAKGQWITSSTIYDTPQAVDAEPGSDYGASETSTESADMSGFPMGGDQDFGGLGALEKTERKDPSSAKAERPMRVRARAVVEKAWETVKARDGYAPAWNFIGTVKVVEALLTQGSATEDELVAVLPTLAATSQNAVAVALSVHRGKQPWRNGSSTTGTPAPRIEAKEHTGKFKGWGTTVDLDADDSEAGHA